MAMEESRADSETDADTSVSAEDPSPKLDLAFKEGQTIKVNITVSTGIVGQQLGPMHDIQCAIVRK